jgi:hypothetical protein
MDIIFAKLATFLETASVVKTFDIAAFVLGNSAMGNATADAIGPSSHTETLTTTTAVYNVGSASVSESLSVAGPLLPVLTVTTPVLIA